MLCGLFSVFDPSTIGGVEVKWVSGVGGMFFCLQYFSIIYGGGKGVLVGSLFESLFQSLPSRNGVCLLLCLGFSILSGSVVGLIPYTFTVTSHLSVALSLSLPLWVGGLLLQVNSTPVSSVAHLLPLGSPAGLWPFLVLVEGVSLIIRPFTLAIRLIANVMAGHLILSLIGGGVTSTVVFIPTLLSECIFLGFESCVALVQTYVFISLLSLYWSE